METARTTAVNTEDLYDKFYLAQRLKKIGNVLFDQKELDKSKKWWKNTESAPVIDINIDSSAEITLRELSQTMDVPEVSSEKILLKQASAEK